MVTLTKAEKQAVRAYVLRMNEKNNPRSVQIKSDGMVTVTVGRTPRMTMTIMAGYDTLLLQQLQAENLSKQ
jgi:Atypical Rib domain